MIVCVCNAIRESEVRDAAREGIRVPGQAYARLGYRVRCGQCVPFAREILTSSQVNRDD